MQFKFYRVCFKRILDIFLAGFVLIISTPILAAVAILLYFFQQKSVFFIQPRPGKSAAIFNLIKFKTMNDKRDPYGNLLPDKDRLTKIGSFLRKTSIDELPQLVNVLKGDMSLIGPRPLLVKYLPLYNNIQTRRHEVRPGITGWTQVNGRNSLSWDEKFRLDVWYVDNLSFYLDLKILWMTMIRVILRDGINAADATTMKPFTGNQSTRTSI